MEKRALSIVALAVVGRVIAEVMAIRSPGAHLGRTHRDASALGMDRAELGVRELREEGLSYILMDYLHSWLLHFYFKEIGCSSRTLPSKSRATAPISEESGSSSPPLACSRKCFSASTLLSRSPPAFQSHKAPERKLSDNLERTDSTDPATEEIAALFATPGLPSSFPPMSSSAPGSASISERSYTTSE